MSNYKSRLNDIKCILEYQLASENFYFSSIECNNFNTETSNEIIDGSILVASNEHRLYVFMLNSEILSDDLSIWQPFMFINQPSVIYDYKWYPKPSSYFFALSCKDQPVHFYNPYNGNLIDSFNISSLSGISVAPISLQFKPDGTSLLCGLKNRICFYDINKMKSAGEINFKDSNYTSQTNNHNSLISCISFPTEESVSNDYFACGSYDSIVGVYDYYSGETIFRNKLDEITPQGGISQLKWGNNGILLYVGTRKCEWIFVYDIRNPSQPLNKFHRPSKNFQKIQFDICEEKGILLSASTDGALLFYENLDDVNFNNESSSITPHIPLHFNSFSGCKIYPIKNSERIFVLTSSGERVFNYPIGSKYMEKDNCTNYYDSRLCCWVF